MNFLCQRLEEEKITFNKEEVCEKSLQFLFGDCVSFAVAFQKIFGGELYAIFAYGKDKHLVHAVVKINEVFVDVNGYHPNFIEYATHYYSDYYKDKEWFKNQQCSIRAASLTQLKKKGNYSSAMVAEAEEFICQFKNFYKNITSVI